MRDPEILPRYARLGGNGEEKKEGPWAALAHERDWLEPEIDTGVADWIVKRSQSCLSVNRCCLDIGPLLPKVFDTCARVLHPAELLTQSREYAPVRWSEVASWNGCSVHALTQFHEITNIYRWNGMDLGSRPEEGSLPDTEMRILSELLKGFTGSPDLYHFGFWDGYGQAEFDPAFQNYPKAGIGDRDYYLFRGRLDLEQAENAFEFHSPTFWWPDDRAWCVVTDIDSMDTLIGGRAACIQAVLNHPELETLPVTLDDRGAVTAAL